MRWGIILRMNTRILCFSSKSFIAFNSFCCFTCNSLLYLHFRPPFTTITVEPELGTASLHCKPSVLEVQVIISQCFDKIIDVGSKIPKIEAIIFPELEKEEFLFPVSRDEEAVNKVYQSIALYNKYSFHILLF